MHVTPRFFKIGIYSAGLKVYTPGSICRRLQNKNINLNKATTFELFYRLTGPLKAINFPGIIHEISPF
jgi:hypothetical protein